MTERPRVLIELGDELDSAARRTLTGRRRRFAGLTLGSALAALAAASAVAVAVAAILLVGHSHGGSGSAASPAAPRGEIVDRDGNVLAGSRRTFDIDVVPAKLPMPVLGSGLSRLVSPPAADQTVYDRLAGALGISETPRKCGVEGHELELARVDCEVAQAEQAPRRLRSVGLAGEVTPADADELAAEKLPGVTESPVSVTTYPHGDLAAQVLGTVGAITAVEVREPQFSGVPDDAIVGQTGLEAFYDRYLRAGDTLKTSLDLKLQQAGQASLARSIADNAPRRAGGAFVAMDPENGQVYAMGSLPSFDPTIFTRPISDKEYAREFGLQSDGPLDNRAIDGLYPTGSAFKPITATAALESGVWSLDQTYDDTGSFNLDGEVLHDSGHAAYGTVNLVSALKVSDDIFFYNLGALLNANPITHPRGGPLQTWARLYGLGRPTGIDLPYEASGVVPSPALLNALGNEERACEKRKHVSQCGIADLRPWTIADSINTAVGQGDDLVTPLQLAVLYAAIANGGSVVRPHIGSEIESSTGVRTIDPPPARHINISPTYLAAIQRGLRESASQPGGTSADVMGNFPEPVYGMTGTAQSFPNGIEEDQAWYAGYVPATATSKPIVVVVTVEKGGFGDVGAAPVARQILSQWFYGKPGVYTAGNSQTL